MHQQYVHSLFGLEGKVVFISGARHGIGEAMAIACARAGAHVALTSRSVAPLRPVAEAVERYGQRALPLAMELTDRESIKAAVQTATAHFGRVDVLINNAAVAIRAESLTYEETDWDQVFDTNCKGLFHCCQAIAPAMIAQGGGRIVNISSVFGRAALPNRAAYGASKAAVEQLTRVLAVEWAPHGIRVNAVAPTTVITPTRAEMFADPIVRAERIRQIPVGRLGVPEDVVGAALFLAAPASEFITGHTIMVDGGYTCL